MDKFVKLALQIGHEAHFRRNCPVDCSVFVRSLKNRTPLKSVIKKVVFTYDQLGELKEVTKTQSPFSIKKTGSEEINIKIDIYFNEVEDVFTYTHHANLTRKNPKANAIRSVEDRVFTIKNPSNELCSAIIRCGGYFTDGVKMEKNIENYSPIKPSSKSASPSTNDGLTRSSQSIRERYLNLGRERQIPLRSSMKDISQFCKKSGSNDTPGSNKSVGNNQPDNEVNTLREQNNKLKAIIMQYDANKEVFFQEVFKLKVDDFFKQHSSVELSLATNGLLEEAKVYIQLDTDHMNSVMKQGDDDMIKLYNITNFYISMHDFFENNTKYYAAFGIDREKIVNIHKLSPSSIFKIMQ